MFLRNLVTTDWLATAFDEPHLRILDCSVALEVNSNGDIVNTAGDIWKLGHIPGSVFVDLKQELSDVSQPFPFALPSPSQFAAVMSRCGIDHGKRVVVYDACRDKWASIWAARVWWMLRVFGFDDVAVLSGGLHKWKLDGYALSTEEVVTASASFFPEMRHALVASKEDVLSSIGDAQCCLINALSAEEHAGRKTRYGRPGRIPTSVNVPATSLVDETTRAFLPPEDLRAIFASTGALDRSRVVTYCGGGIAACGDALALAILGVEDVAVYDGSLFEWTADAKLPLEVAE